jgi:hypothetical protein
MRIEIVFTWFKGLYALSARSGSGQTRRGGAMKGEPGSRRRYRTDDIGGKLVKFTSPGADRCDMGQEHQPKKKKSWRVRLSMLLLAIVAVVTGVGYAKPSVVYYTSGRVNEHGESATASQRREVVNNACGIRFSLKQVQFAHGENAVDSAGGEPFKNEWFWWTGGKCPSENLPLHFAPAKFAGFGYSHLTADSDKDKMERLGDREYRSASVPTWFLALVALLPAMSYWRGKRKSAAPKADAPH